MYLKKIIAVIPARGGSKGIKHKNLYKLNGKPLIEYTINAARQSKYIDRIVVSTDDIQIAEVAKELGVEVPFLRPIEFALDTSNIIETVMDVISKLNLIEDKYDSLILLQPTQPLRQAFHIDEAIEKYYMNEMQSLASVSKTNNHPLLIREINKQGELTRIPNKNSTCRRQDMSEAYFVNGCIYINALKELSTETSFNDNKIPYIMDKIYAVDIDEIDDIYLAEYYIKHYNIGKRYNHEHERNARKL